MGVNFSPFEIGRRALRANQVGINVTGRNIANVNTPGYTRQSLQLNASSTGAAFEESQFGVVQIRDQFVETRLQSETAISGRLSAKRDALSPVDTVFSNTDAPGGLQSALTGFFGAFRDLEAQPASVPLRSNLILKADTLVSAFHSTRQRLVDTRSDANESVFHTVDEANVISKKIADLNVEVSIVKRSGGDNTALLDQRGEAVRKLAELTGARALEAGDGQITVSLGNGKPLVVGDQVFELNANTQADGSVEILLEGEAAVISDGRLRGLQDAITEIGGHITNLDQLAESIAGRVNTLHASGSDLDGNAGVDFFATPSSGTVTAANLEVSSAIAANPRLVVTAASGAGRGDATVARNLAGLFQDSASVIGTETTSYDNFFSSLVTEAGAGVRSAEDALATQQVILAQTEAQRASVSGVSLDEEAVRLLQYQKAYEAAARFLKVANDMTQTILSLAQ
jgi:flagellar hook-associated protein 1 FlgK